jgi:hypothetical protein
VSQKQFILAIAGAPASGKTTLAGRIAATTGAVCISFGELVRREAGSRHLGTDRGSLQTLGGDMLRDLGPRGLCELALARAALTTEVRPVIWDGVRHVPVLDELRGLYAPAAVTLVVLAPPEAARYDRFSASASSQKELDAWEAHETESHLPDLISEADLVCDEASPAGATATLLRLLASGR